MESQSRMSLCLKFRVLCLPLTLMGGPWSMVSKEAKNEAEDLLGIRKYYYNGEDLSKRP
jgi:hypothetical protein